MHCTALAGVLFVVVLILVEVVVVVGVVLEWILGEVKVSCVLYSSIVEHRPPTHFSDSGDYGWMGGLVGGVGRAGGGEWK